MTSLVSRDSRSGFRGIPAINIRITKHSSKAPTKSPSVNAESCAAKQDVSPYSSTNLNISLNIETKSAARFSWWSERRLLSAIVNECGRSGVGLSIDSSSVGNTGRSGSTDLVTIVQSRHIHLLLFIVDLNIESAIRKITRNLLAWDRESTCHLDWSQDFNVSWRFGDASTMLSDGNFDTRMPIPHTSLTSTPSCWKSWMPS